MKLGLASLAGVSFVLVSLLQETDTHGGRETQQLTGRHERVEAAVAEVLACRKVADALIPEMIKLSAGVENVKDFVLNGEPFSIAAAITCDDANLGVARVLVECYDKMVCGDDKACVDGLIRRDGAKADMALQEKIEYLGERLRVLESLPVAGDVAGLRRRAVDVCKRAIASYRTLVVSIKG